jgi:hypothetical protein
MPKKVKQKQKQKQKQSQTVIVNIHKGKRSKRQEKQTRQPPPTPQYVPYPVPNLRGPDPVVPSQASLIQMLEALRPIQAPVVARVPAVPPPIHIPVDDGKEEVGPEVMVARTPPMLGPDSALVSAGPSSSSSSSSSAPSSSSGPGDPVPYTYDFLKGLNIRDGAPTLKEIGQRLNIPLMSKMNKEGLIQAILAMTDRKTMPPWR